MFRHSVSISITLTFFEQFLDSYGVLTDRVLGPGVKVGAYHLQLIGVSPSHQRKGVATALMRTAEEKVSSTHPLS